MCEKTDVSAILEDLGYTASDLMNVNFVFIVEGETGQEPPAASDPEILFGDLR